MRTTLIILLALCAPVALAVHDTIDFDPLGRIRHTEVIAPGEELLVRANIVNLADTELENIRVAAYMPELGLFSRTTRFDLGDDEKLVRVLFFDIPEDTPSGVYLIMVTAHGENGLDFRSRDYRFVYVE